MDRVAELAAEVGPVLALLADTEAKAEAIRSAAANEAGKQRRDANGRAARMIAEARSAAEQERAEGIARARAAADERTAAALAAARDAADHTAEVAEQRLDEYVARVLDEVRNLLSKPS